MTRPQGTMDNDFFGDLVQQAKDLGASTISPFGFGEPLLDRDLELKLWCIKLNQMQSFITTNGSLCTWARMSELFAAGLNHIRFSIHGICDIDYSKVHKGFTFDTVMTNLLSTIYLRDSFYKNRKVSIVSIPMSGEKVEDIVNEWEQYNIDWLEVWRPHNWATVKQFRTKTKLRKKTCNRPQKGPLQIQWDGKVIPCCFLTDAEIVLGDAHEQTLEEILKGEPYRELRKRHEEGDLKGLPCENCDQLNQKEESPLLYSNRDTERKISTTSSIKFDLEE